MFAKSSLLILAALALLAWWLSRDERWRSLPLGDPEGFGDISWEDAWREDYHRLPWARV